MHGDDFLHNLRSSQLRSQQLRDLVHVKAHERNLFVDDGIFALLQRAEVTDRPVRDHAALNDQDLVPAVVEVARVLTLAHVDLNIQRACLPSETQELRQRELVPNLQRNLRQAPLPPDGVNDAEASVRIRVRLADWGD